VSLVANCYSYLYENTVNLTNTFTLHIKTECHENDTVHAYTNDNPRKLSVDPQYIGLFIILNGNPVTFAGNKMPK